MEKAEGFDQEKLFDLLFEVKKKYPEYKTYAEDHVAMVLEFFERAKEYGIRYQS